MSVEFHRGPDGTPSAVSGPPMEALGAFFTREIGADPSYGDEILDALEGVVAGEELGGLQINSGLPTSNSYVIIEDAFVNVVCDVVGVAGSFQEVRRDVA